MYAIFEDGSHQHKVSQGDLVTIDYREAEIGTRVELGRVLLYSNGTDLRIGQPTIAGLRIVGEVVEHPSTKLYIQHFRRRKTYRRLRGHRQHYTQLKISHILLPGEAMPPVETKPVAAPAPAESSAPASATAPEATAPAAPATT